jgi:hypothetical protein
MKVTLFGNWLWVVCWRLDLQPEQLEQQMMYGFMSGGEMQIQSLPNSISTKTTAVTAEKPIREQILDLKDSVQFLERIWLNDPSIRNEIDPSEWQQFMDKVYDGFNEIKMINSKSLDLPEELQ